MSENIIADMAGLFDRVREDNPLVHCITNYVTVNDCANALLAVGGSPIMADDIGEAAEIASIASAVVVNMGTLNERTCASMIAAAKSASEHGRPVIFDPVGAGASKYRRDFADKFFKSAKPSVIRGNLSEISYIAGIDAEIKGVDSAAGADMNKEEIAVLAARKYGCTVAVTGAVDIVTDGKRVIRLENGTPLLSKITGTGCMSSAITGAYCAVSDDMTTAAACGITAISLSGELAYGRANAFGLGSFKAAIFDEMSKLGSKTVMNRCRADEKNI